MVVRFWTDHAMSQWSRAVRNLALARRLDLEETAQLMALAHVSGGDSAIGCWEAKYYFNFWRPVHAIQRAGTDGNADTATDAIWTHLVAGNHPEYPSGHACVTGGVTRDRRLLRDRPRRGRRRQRRDGNHAALRSAP
jgi:hypothetical protein